MRFRSRLQRPSWTPHLIVFLAFLAWYGVLVLDIRHWSHRDPSSAFFDPVRAFERKYSHAREAEAESYIQIVSKYGQEPGLIVKAGEQASMCVGIPTVQREGARYFRRTVGSVLAGLTETERKDIFLVPFIANSDPTVHSAYGEEWLDLVSDEVLTYAEAPAPVRDMIKGLEAVDSRDFDRKPLFDYTYLLKHCYNRGTPYVVVLEDDVIGAEGWYYRTKMALETLEQQPKKEREKALYLRLFYNERILGWNSEEWPSYLVRIALVELTVLGVLLLAVFFVPHAGKVLTPLTVLTILSVVMPMFIVIYFLAGRLTVSPMPYGLNRMDTYDCCSQAFVFPRDQIPHLLAYYNSVGSGKVDQLTEDYADEHGLARWALTPSVFAHVGSTSSKTSFITKWGRTNTENIWNFSFEMLDMEKLKDEHL